MKFILIVFSWLIFCSLYASEVEERFNDVEMRLSADCEPIATVAGCVNVITGCFFQVENDFTGNTIDPIRLDRTYSSGNFIETFLGMGFGSQFPLLATRAKTSNDAFFALISERDGCLLPYKSYHKKGSFEIDRRILKKGHTNLSKLESNSHVNYVNWSAKYDSKTKGNYWSVTQGDGLKRIYGKSFKLSPKKSVELGISRKRIYLLTQEIKPNGNSVHYDYISLGGKPRLSKIWTTNRLNDAVLNSVEMKYDEKSCVLTSSCGQKVVYNQETKILYVTPETTIEKKVLYAATPSKGIPTLLNFQKDSKSWIGIREPLKQVIRPEGRILEAQYKRGKVKSLMEPGEDGQLFPTYHFHYNKRKTTVQNAHGQKKQYIFDSNKRIIEIKTFEGVLPCFSETFKWSKESSEEGWLKEKAIKLGKETYQKWSYAYDSRGNVISKTLHGNLTGLKCSPFKKDDQTDSYTISYCYSADGKNLLISKVTPEGVTTTYSYLPGTNLKTKKLEFYRGKIQARVFIQYDKNGEVKKIVEDDGSEQEENNLTDVSFRKITRIEAETNPERPSFGKPKRMNESYLAENQEIPLIRKEYEYDEEAREIKCVVYDSKNQFCYQISKSYDSKGRIVLLSDKRNQITRFAYDENNNKIEEELIGSGELQTFQYDLRNRLTQKTSIHQNGESFTTTYRYNQLNQLIFETDHYENETHYTYDRLGRRITENKPLVKNEAGALIRPTMHRKFNILNQLIEEQDEKGNTTHFEHTIRGSPTAVIRSDGSKQHFLYYISGWLKNQRLEDGTSIAYTYDAIGNVIEQCRVDINGALLDQQTFTYKGSLLLSKTDLTGLITTYAYDGRGLRIEENIGGIKKIGYEYDDFGQLIKKIEWISKAKARCEVFSYDWEGHLTSKIQQDLNGCVFFKECYRYDLKGNQTEKILFFSEEVTASHHSFYGSDGKLIREENPLGHEKTTDYDHKHQSDTGTYSLLLTRSEPLQREERQEFDSHGRICKKSFFDHGKQLSSTQYLYDAKGLLARRSESVMVDGAFCRDYSISYTYTARGLKETELEQPEGILTRYMYDSSGRIVQKIKPDGVILFTSYDSLGRVERLSSSDGTIHYTYDYDLYDHPIEVYDHINHKTHRCSYDILGRIAQEELASGITFKFTHDPLDRITSVTFPDASSIMYSYDPFHLQKVMRFDSQNKLMYETECLEYDWSGNLLREHSPPGMISSIYDLLGRALSISSAGWSSTVQQFDPVGNLLAIELIDPSGKESKTLSYDSFDNIQKECGQINNHYLYDSLRNCLEKNGFKTTIGESNQLLKDSSSSYVYDKNGNLIFQSNPAISYRYDALDRLIAIEKNNEITRLLYDTFDRCLQITDSSCVKQLIYVKNQEIGAIWGGKIQELKIAHPDSNKEKVFAVELGGETFFSLQDQRGSISALRNFNGSFMQWSRFSAFGDTQHFGNLEPINPWTFANRRQVEGLFLFAHRWYHPQMMRWQTKDPLGFEDGLNLYQYTQNNPYYYKDPSGHFAIVIPLLVGTFGSGGLMISAPAVSAIAATAIGSALGVYVYNNCDTWVNLTFNKEAVEEKGFATENQEPISKPPYSGDLLGDDPTVCPGEGFEWKGKGNPASGYGSWHNSRTEESLHPDLKHPLPKGPHWDYEAPGFEARLFLDGTWERK